MLYFVTVAVFLKREEKHEKKKVTGSLKQN
jgi:hypothetical protein